ncbi:MAG: RNA polymerase sigma factor [Deltaproteobacteria bacterium]|nr:RNA polymerase sigma factor [Deltaproteobacteria bacterium]
MLPAPTVQMPAVALVLDDQDVVEIPSFDEVYVEHVAFVWRTLRAFGVAEPQLEDATQDAFVVVHRRLPEWEGRAAITTWLFAIARRVACSYRRKRGTERERNQPLDEQPEVAGPADTFVALSRAQAAATVMQVLDGIDEDKRVVFALVELEQMSVPDVARMLELNLNTAYSRLRLARQAFELAVRALAKGAQ